MHGHTVRSVISPVLFWSFSDVQGRKHHECTIFNYLHDPLAQKNLFYRATVSFFSSYTQILHEQKQFLNGFRPINV